MKEMFRTYGFATLRATQHDNGEIILLMMNSEMQRVTMHVWPHEARLVADMIYKVAAEGGLDE